MIIAGLSKKIQLYSFYYRMSNNLNFLITYFDNHLKIAIKAVARAKKISGNIAGLW